MTSSLAKLRALTPRERRILCAALVLLPAVGARLRMGGLKGVHASIGRLALRKGADSPDKAREIARLVSIAARRGPYRAECLPTALALQWLLRRHGIQGDLRVGVRRKGRQIEAHAWVEHEGVALIDGAEVHERFGAFPAIRYPHPA